MRIRARVTTWRGLTHGLTLFALIALFPDVSKAGTSIFGKQYTRTTGHPNSYTDKFQNCDTAAQYKMVVANRGISSASIILGGISSASIILNGTQLFGPSDFNKHVDRLEKPVTLAHDNELLVRLASKPGSGLTIDVECTGGCASCGGPVPPGSCLGTGLLSALVVGNNVTAYVPKGGWTDPTTGVSVVTVEPSITPTPIPIATDEAINSCASNPITGQTVCTANNNHVYILKGTGLDPSVSPNPLASAGTGTISFSLGSCTNCSVMMDSIHNKAALALSVADGMPGFQFLDLGPSPTTTSPSPTFEPPFTSPSRNISEDPLLDPINNLLLSATEDNNYEIVDIAKSTSPAFFENSINISPMGGEADSSSQDCSTRIALASFENGTRPAGSTSAVYLADLTQATFGPGSPGTWSVPATAEKVQILDGSILNSGASGSSVAQGTHTGVITGELGGSAVTAIALPTTSGSGTPTITNWMSCDIPGQFGSSGDPHAITAYQSPNSGHAIALMKGTVPAGTILAVVDLTLMLSLPETAPGSHLCASPGTLPANVVSFVTVP